MKVKDVLLTAAIVTFAMVVVFAIAKCEQTREYNEKIDQLLKAKP